VGGGGEVWCRCTHFLDKGKRNQINHGILERTRFLGKRGEGGRTFLEKKGEKEARRIQGKSKDYHRSFNGEEKGGVIFERFRGRGGGNQGRGEFFIIRQWRLQVFHVGKKRSWGTGKKGQCLVVEGGWE